MATVTQLVESAYRLIDHVQPGTVSNTDDLNTGLDALNRMLDVWVTEGCGVYAMATDLATTAGPLFLSWGAASDITTARPTRLKAVTVTYNNLPMPVRIVLADEYAASALDLTDTGYPEICTYDYFPVIGTLRFFPKPPAAGTVTIYSYKPLIGTLTLSTTLALPPGYEHAIRHNLAAAVAPEFRRQVPESVSKEALVTKAALSQLAATILGPMLPSQVPQQQ